MYTFHYASSSFAALVVVVLVVNLVHAQQMPPPGGFYTTRYDHLDIERILNQKRLVHYYTECLLDRGPCTPQGVEFKRILPEALRTNCLRCTEKQRFVTLKSIRRLKKEYPDVWAQLAEIWDPTGEYVQKLEDSFNKKPNRSPEIPQASSTNIQVVPNVQSPTNQPSESPVIASRFGAGDNQPERVNIPLPSTNSETLPTPKPRVQTEAVSANTIANKPISFSTTTSSTTTTTTSTTRSPTRRTSTSTQRPYTAVLQERLSSTTHRVSYNYDFAVTIRPVQKLPATGINMVFKGVNTLIQPITDIAGRLISAGTDITGIVLNALGVRRTY